MSQVHFLGLEITENEARVTLLARDGTVVAAARERLSPGRPEDAWIAYEPRRLAREAADAVRELVESSGVPTSRIWGWAPAAPPGWIALDAQWEPMSDLVLARDPWDRETARGLSAFLAEDARRGRHLALVLPPKDYLRFHWSRIIATDPSDAWALGLLAPRGHDWDMEKAAAAGIELDCLPPILPSTYACGMVGPGGEKALSLPAASWSAVGCSACLATLAACGTLDEPAGYLSAADAARLVTTGAPGPGGRPFLSGDAAVYSSKQVDGSPLAHHTVIIDWRADEDPADAIAWARAQGCMLYAAPFAGADTPGAAVCAALASGTFGGGTSFFRRVARPRPIE